MRGVVATKMKTKKKSSNENSATRQQRHLSDTESAVFEFFAEKRNWLILRLACVCDDFWAFSRWNDKIKAAPAFHHTERGLKKSLTMLTSQENR